jgi:glycerate 2-kinase
MKILIAPDSFKDCLSAKQAADFLKEGISKASKTFEIKILPMADGGEGTVDAIIEATGGSYLSTKVHDPLMRKVEAKYGVSGDGNTAIIEMAAASGIELLKTSERNPWITSSYGTGELIQTALTNNCHRIIIGIGGSATNDAGVGMASALGINFLDSSGNKIEYGGGGLSKLSRIDISCFDERLKNCEILVACDVKNSLTGPAGASYVYGPQKGADKDMVKKLDDNLKHFAELVRRQFNIEIESIPGSGAAGGLGACLLAFLNARLQSGFELVKNETRLEDYCKWADVVITGEGKIDAQTKYGKTPQGVANTAKEYGKKVFAVAGTLADNYQELYSQGFDFIFSILDKPMPLETAIKNAPELLLKAGYSIGMLLANK